MTKGRSHRLALPAGYKLHWYEIVSILGQGGFGITYLARDTNLDQHVAIKEFLPTDLAVRTHDSSVQPLSEGHTDTYGWGLQRFVTEAQTLAKFRHPNIVQVFTVFQDNGTAYMIMEYVQGRTLEDALKFQRIEGESQLKQIIFSLLDGLTLIHDAGFIHRDIKPENIYLRNDSTPVLLDFGSARQAVGGKTRTLTALVSPGYAPYEQYDSSRAGETKQGPWTDIYALGATLYRAISGKGPIDAMARINAAMAGEDLFQKASVIGAGSYSAAFLRAIDWALELRPPDRPQYIQVWRKALSGQYTPEAETVKSAAAPPGLVDSYSAVADKPLSVEATREIFEPAKRTGFRLGLGIGGLALVILTGVGWWFISSTNYSRESPPAELVSSGIRQTPTQRHAEPLSASQPTVTVAPQAESDLEVIAARTVPEKETSESTESERAAAIEAGRPAIREGQQQRVQALVKKQDRVAKLLELANTDFEAERYTSPPGENALERFEEVLKLEPGNSVAREGKDKIFTRFLEIGNAMIEKEHFSEAEAALLRAESVDPGSAAVRLAKIRLNETKLEAESRALIEQQKAVTESEQKKNDKIMALLSAADNDLKAFRLTSPAGNNAFEGYRSVLELDADNTRARQGLLEIVQRYIELEARAVSENQFDKASDYLEKAEKVLPGSELTASARLELEQNRAEYDLAQARVAAKESRRSAEESTREEAVNEDGRSEQLASIQPQPALPEAERRMPAAQPTDQLRKAKIALFPSAIYLGANENSNAETDMRRVISPIFNKIAGDQFVHSYLSPSQSSIANYDQVSLWSGPTNSQKPNKMEVLRLARRFDADVVIMYFFRSKGGGRYVTDYDAEIFQIDVRSGNITATVADNSSVGEATRNLVAMSISTTSKRPVNVVSTETERSGKYMRCETPIGDRYELFESDGAWRAAMNGKNISVQVDFKTGVVGPNFTYEDCIAPIYVNRESVARIIVNFSSPTSRGSLRYNATNNATCSISKDFAEMGLCSGTIVSR